MQTNGIVTLLTDFGFSDVYVGALKGALLSVDAGLRPIDVTHEIPPQDVLSGALALRAYAGVFPAGTVHLAVVDPSVGTARRPLAASYGGRLFVGPDNGLLSLALGNDALVYEITDRSLFREPLSAVFHGRDVFAPAAAHLALGRDPATLGPRVRDWRVLELPATRLEDGVLIGQVLCVDRFGNLTSNIEVAQLGACGPAGSLQIELEGQAIGPLCAVYADVPAGAALALIGSSGLLEIAVNRGCAADALGAGAGDEVRVRTRRD